VAPSGAGQGRLASGVPAPTTMTSYRVGRCQLSPSVGITPCSRETFPEGDYNVKKSRIFLYHWHALLSITFTFKKGAMGILHGRQGGEAHSIAVSSGDERDGAKGRYPSLLSPAY